MLVGVVAGERAATWTAASIGAGSGYNFNNASRKVLSRARQPGSRTANELGLSEMTPGRDYARHLERNHPTARAGADASTALVVGMGIALEPDQPEWTPEQTAQVREDWAAWCECATVDGRSLYELQAQGWRETFIAGELIWRWVMPPEAGEIPLKLMPLESEWLDNTSGGIYSANADGTAKVGPITVDRYGRPISYDLRSPEMAATSLVETVPATSIIHVFEPRRSMQTRGESWLAPVVETMQQERDLVDTELAAAVNTASIGVVVTSAYQNGLDTTEEGTTEDPAQSLKIGGVARLFPGDDVKSFGNTRPSQQIMPFRAGLRGDMAAAMRVPQRFLDRDISRVGSYSAMRGDNQDEERLMGPVREWYGHRTAGRCYRDILPFICAKRGIPLPKRIRYTLLPDGQPYVNPVEDIKAANDAIDSGLSTRQSEVAKRGGDWKRVEEQNAAERTARALASIAQVAAVQTACEASGVPGLTWNQVMTLPGIESAPAPVVAAPAPQPEPQPVATAAPERSAYADGLRDGAEMSKPAGVTVTNETRVTMDAAAAAIMGEAMAKAMPQPVAPIVNVQTAAPAINVMPATVMVPETVVNVAAPSVTVAAPTVHVTAPQVHIDNVVEVPQRKIKATPGRDGSVIMETVE
jgi:lambda family phage portal protein